MTTAADLPDYPFTPQRFQVRPGIAMSYLDEGPRDGEVVLMLHGNPTWSYYWRHLVLALRGTHRCVVPDHIGMGLSDKPGDDRYEYSLQRRVDDLDAFVRGVIDAGGTTAPAITLVVHDWGGMIGFAWACRHPQRIAEANANAKREGVSHLVTFRLQDAMTTDVSGATVVTLYLLSASNLKLRPILTKQLKPGARIVSHSFSMGDWQPDKVDTFVDTSGTTRTLYLWKTDGKIRP